MGRTWGWKRTGELREGAGEARGEASKEEESAIYSYLSNFFFDMNVFLVPCTNPFLNKKQIKVKNKKLFGFI